MNNLADNDLTLYEDVLTGTDGGRISEAMFQIATGNISQVGSEDLQMLNQLGWTENAELTRLGGLVADPMREYGFWLRRNRRLPIEEHASTISSDLFAGKNVIELGSGGGCNLFSLAGVADSLVGIEPVPLYGQLSHIIAKMEGLPSPRLIQSYAEEIPFPDNSFDVAICFSSHQYMLIDTAIREIARVLSPGGEVIIIGNTLYHYIWESLLRTVTSFELGQVKYDMLSIVNTISYQLFGRHLHLSSDHTTASPIYPSFRYMKNLLLREGLILDHERTIGIPSGETVFVAAKSG